MTTLRRLTCLQATSLFIINVPTLTHDRGSDLHRNVTRFMTSTTVHFYTVLENKIKLRWERADSGGRLFDERPVTLTRVGTLSFLGCCHCEPVCDGTYFPRGMSFALRVKGSLPLCHQKESWQRMHHSPPAWAKRLSLVGVPPR